MRSNKHLSRLGFEFVKQNICITQMQAEYRSQKVVFNIKGLLYPESVVGIDSHTTMIDGLGVAGWVVGGIEAEATLLGQYEQVVNQKVLSQQKQSVQLQIN